MQVTNLILAIETGMSLSQHDYNDIIIVDTLNVWLHCAKKFRKSYFFHIHQIDQNNLI